jgi:ribosomal protein S18 acetylase RimI-like enzyme
MTKKESQNLARRAPKAFALRPVLQEDEDFLSEVYASTRTDELIQTGWDEALQRAFLTQQFTSQQQYYKDRFPEGEHQIILVNNLRAGRIYVAGSDKEIRILDLTLLPQYRNAGIGTSILQDILTEAKTSRKPVRIYVESFNRSLGLFERLGFRKASEAGMHFLMEWVSDG